MEPGNFLWLKILLLLWQPFGAFFVLVSCICVRINVKYSPRNMQIVSFALCLLHYKFLVNSSKLLVTRRCKDYTNNNKAQPNDTEILMSLIARLMGPTWGPSGADRPRWAPCWPHELCYLGYFVHRIINIQKWWLKMIDKLKCYFQLFLFFLLKWPLSTCNGPKSQLTFFNN